jgi:hypothetical protein
MPELGIPEYAAHLGVSADTVRRRIRAGEIPARRDARGRYVVLVPDEEADELQAAPMQRDDVVVVRRELLHAQELAEAERRRGDELAIALEAANKGQDELRVLLLRQSEQLARLLPAPREEPQESPQEHHQASSVTEQATQHQRRPGWRRLRWPWRA